MNIDNQQETITRTDEEVDGLIHKYVLEDGNHIDWFNEHNDLYAMFLDDTFDRDVVIPSEIEGTLYPYQKSVFKVLTQWVRGTNIKLNNYNTKSSAVLISANFGSGKTLIVLTFLAHLKLYPFVNNKCDVYSYEQFPPNTSFKTHKFESVNHTPYNPYISSSKIKINSNYRLPAIIVVGQSMLMQWRSEIHKFYPSLKVLYIKNINDIYKVCLMVKNNFDELKKYDVIVLRNSNIFDPKKYYLDYIKKEYGIVDSCLDSIGAPQAIKVFKTMLPFITFDIAVYDDYDMIGITNEKSAMVLATKHIFLSGTITDIIPYSFESYNRYYDTQYSRITYEPKIDNIGNIMEIYDRDNISIYEKYMLFNNNNLHDLYNNICLKNIFNISPTTDYINESLCIDIPSYYQTTIYNPDDIYADIADSFLEADNKDKVISSIHAGDYSSMAKECNMMNHSIHDIMSKILGNNMDKYLESLKTIEYLEDVLECWDELPYENNPNYEYTYDDINGGAEIDYLYGGLDELIDKIIKSNKYIKDDIGVKLDKIRDTMKKQMCQLCYIDDITTDKAIFTCDYKGNQSIITCTSCIGDYTRARVSKNDGFSASCLICSKHRVKLSNFIFIDKDLDLSSFVKDDIEGILDKINEEKEQKEDVLQWKKYIRTDKKQPVKDILNGFIPTKTIQITVNMTKLLKGKVRLPDAPYRKVIIVSANTYYTHSISEYLTNNGFKHSILKGDYMQIDDIVNDFNAIVHTEDKHQDKRQFGTSINDRILIVNTTYSCAGLNLQTATDMIITHHISNISQETQVLARIIRSGMLYHTNIWYLTGSSEAKFYTHLLYDETKPELNNVELAQKIHNFENPPTSDDNDDDNDE